MRVALLGPVCRDVNVVRGKRHEQPGGAVYYAGHALSSLGCETTVFGSFGNEPKAWLRGFRYGKLVHIMSEGTIRFTNEYISSGRRLQRADILDNGINDKDIGSGLGHDFTVLCPLFHDNIPASLIRSLSKKPGLVLSAQGMIRYLERGKIVWRHPDNVIRALPFIDYLSLDDSELRFISGKNGIRKGAGSLQSKGAKNIIVTQNRKGSHLFLDGRHYKINAFPPGKLVDPTGAGDSYLAGFLFAQTLFDDPIKQGEFAAMTATMKIENRGPFSGTVKSVLRRLAPFR